MSMFKFIHRLWSLWWLLLYRCFLTVPLLDQYDDEGFFLPAPNPPMLHDAYTTISHLCAWSPKAFVASIYCFPFLLVSFLCSGFSPTFLLASVILRSIIIDDYQTSLAIKFYLCVERSGTLPLVRRGEDTHDEMHDIINAIKFPIRGVRGRIDILKRAKVLRKGSSKVVFPTY